MNSPFNKVFLYKSTTTEKNPENLIICESPENYNQLLENDTEGLCELIGGEHQQIKPIIDIDQYKTDIDIEAFKTDLNVIFPNKEIKYCKRNPRPYNGRMKYSYRVYVQDVRISYINLKTLLEEFKTKYNGIDDGLYIKNRILYTPNTKYKYDLKTKKYYEVPQLKLMDDAELFECCASYIEESFEDWDLKMPPIEIKKQIIEPKINDNDNDNDYDETPNKYNRLVHLINLISPFRSDNFDTWIKFDWCLINICNKEHISKRKCYELIHQFSKLSTSNYNEDDVDKWIDDNYDKVKEKGYGWNYLIHTCIKEDNPKYYETISKSYFNMKKDFEQNNAKILYPPMIVHEDRNGENIIQPIPLCEKTNRHIKCSVKETNKKDEIVYKDKKFIELWLDDPKIRKYDKYVFKPTPLKVEDYEYNTWTDFDITKTPLEKDDDDEIINRFLDYMKNLFDDENVVNYIIAYFANRIQNPAIRNMVCIILYGEEGDGKNRLFDIFKNIIGDKYYTELENAKQMFGSHSCVEKEKLFICVNEAKGKDNYENSETLKARITTDKLLINPKGIQEFKIDNFCDYIMTTNNANAVNLHDKSRRYLYVETTSYYSRNSEFFNKLSNDIVDNPKALRIIYEYLKAFDIRKIIPSGNFQNHIPETEIQKVIIKNNRDKILWFLEDYINDYINDPLNKEEKEEIKIKNSELFSKWNNWIERNKMDVKYNNIAFHSRLGQLMKKKINCIDECIYKDTNQNTYIRFKKLSSFFDKLNQ
jgi:hypothetical protein